MRQTLFVLVVLVLLAFPACHKKQDPIPGAPGGQSDKPLAPGELPGDAQIKNPEVAYNMALEFANQQNMEAAQHYVDLAMLLEPNSKYAYTKGLFCIAERKFDEGLENLQGALDLGPGTEENRLAVLNAMGICYMELGKDEDALTKFREVVNKPGLFSRYEAYYNMGVVYLRQQKYLDAEAVFQKVLEENPGYFKAYNKLGMLKAQKGDWPGAAISFKKAIDLIAMDYRAIQTSGAELYCNYGEALVQQGLYPKAREALLQVLKISPESQYGLKAKQILASIEGAG